MHELSITQGLVDADLNRTGEPTADIAQRCARRHSHQAALPSSGSGEAFHRHRTRLIPLEAR